MKDTKATMTTATQSTLLDRHAGFYYTPAGITDNEATPLEHLALGLAHNIVANGTRKQLPSGTTVVNYAKANDKYYATVGISTGNVVPGSPRRYWPSWSSETSVVFEVVWVTKIVEVPAEYFAKQRQYLPASEVEQVANYVLRNNR
jgi:uncharacterized protein (DUF4213/DUF364 family)